MKREASIAIPDGDLQRLEAYGVAIRQIRSGQFLARQCLSVSGSTVDPANPVDVLGYELAQLAQWLELRFGEFRKILEVSEEISSELFAEKVLDRIYQTFSSLIPYDRIGCALLSENGQRLSAYWARASYENLKINKHYTADMAGSSLETTLVSGKPRIINDLEEYLFYHPDSVSTQLILAEGIHSNLTCPLIANGKPLGFLFFSSCQTNTYRDLHHDISCRLPARFPC